jgi:magnesium transporter
MFINNIDDVIDQSSDVGVTLRQEFDELHPADAVDILEQLDKKSAHQLFLSLSNEHKLALFIQFTDIKKITYLDLLSEKDRRDMLRNMSVDELTDFFDDMSDQELVHYLPYLQRKRRDEVLALLQFDSESAGGAMDTNVLTLMENFSVEKCVKIVQRLQPNRELHHRIFVTDQDNQLTGYIFIEDLVLQKPHMRISDIKRENDLAIQADEDRETVAQKMRHYDVTIVPVVDEHYLFLGVIASDTLVEILEEEYSEDIQRIGASMTPIRNTYFDTSFFRLLYQRSSVLVVLLLAQSLSSVIIKHYEATLAGFLSYFITVLASTGGNTSSQTSALVIQGLANGEIEPRNMNKFLRREMLIALAIACILGVFAFFRIYITHGYLIGSFIVSISIAIIVLIAVVLGSCIPLLLNKLKLDPAHSAGPLLATLMDIVGIMVYCLIAHYAFSIFLT